MSRSYAFNRWLLCILFYPCSFGQASRQARQEGKSPQWWRNHHQSSLFHTTPQSGYIHLSPKLVLRGRLFATAVPVTPKRTAGSIKGKEEADCWFNWWQKPLEGHQEISRWWTRRMRGISQTQSDSTDLSSFDSDLDWPGLSVVYCLWS